MKRTNRLYVTGKEKFSDLSSGLFTFHTWRFIITPARCRSLAAWVVSRTTSQCEQTSDLHLLPAIKTLSRNTR